MKIFFNPYFFTNLAGPGDSENPFFLAGDAAAAAAEGGRRWREEEEDLEAETAAAAMEGEGDTSRLPRESNCV